MNKAFCFLLLFLWSGLAIAQSVYDLEDIIGLAKKQSPLSRQLETQKENRYWQYRFYKSGYAPQLRVNGNAPGYNRDFVSNRLDDNTVIFLEREQTFSSINLGLLQPISTTGGEISINTDLNTNRNIPQNSSFWSSTLVNVRLDQPIFGYNQLKWDKKTEPLRYEESKREYVEEMELLSERAVELFFEYLTAQVNLSIAQFNLSQNDTIYNIERGRYNIGTTTRDKLLQVELQLLRSKQDVAQANLDLNTSELDIRTYVGLADTGLFTFRLPEKIPDFEISAAEAVEYAKLNRADYIAFERRRIEADKQVAQAKGQKNEINMVASYGLNSTGSTFGDSYDNVQNQQRLNVQFNIPILDWGRNKARTKTAVANKRLQDYVILQEERAFEQEIVILVNQFEVLRLQIDISRKSDEVAQERYLVAQNQYLIGNISITDLNIALIEKDNAKRSYLASLKGFWMAYFTLRRLTLYDFENKELLFKQE